MGSFVQRLLLWGLAILLPLAQAQFEEGFIQRRDHQLMLNGKPFYFIGANNYALNDWSASGKPEDRAKIDVFFRKCSEVGLRVIRMWGFNHKSPMAKGVYDAQEMQGYDYVISSARMHGVRLVIALGNMWEAYKSPEDYMRMAGLDPAQEDLLSFYESPACRSVYKDHLLYMVNRVNTLTGLAYKDDPTIMLWDVINEPRCPGCTEAWQQQVMAEWLREMTDHVKQAAPRQLVAAGMEGMFMSSEHVRWNPGAGTYCEGEDWSHANDLPSLDVSTSHIYDRQMESVPPTWRLPTWDDLLHFFHNYLDLHEQLSRQAGKPHVVEEFNVLLPHFSASQRSQVFQLAYDALLASQGGGGALAGVMFWSAALGPATHDDGYNVYLDADDSVTTTTTTTSATTSTDANKQARRLLQNTTTSSNPVSPSNTPTVTTPSSPPASSTPSASTPSASTTTPASTPSASTTSASTTTSSGTPTAAAPAAARGSPDAFRRVPQRAACADQQAGWWTPLWDQAWARTVDVVGLANRTAGRSVQEVIRTTARQLYGYAGAS